MSIYLVGAGPSPDSFPEVFDRFAEDVRQAPGPKVRIAVVIHDRNGDPLSRLPEYSAPLIARIPCEVLPVPLNAGRADPGLFDGVDGVVVGGGLTPAYIQGLDPARSVISSLVAAGIPYLGFSAGAMVAPQKALIGGYRIGNAEVCGEECSEDLDSLDIRDGLGLAPFAVDVHAAQAGTLSRATAAVAAGLVERAVAVDEDTALVLDGPGAREFTVIGAGHCWDIRCGTGGVEGQPGGPVTVAMLAAG